jgi:hypothetical protein
MEAGNEGDPSVVGNITEQKPKGKFVSGKLLFRKDITFHLDAYKAATEQKSRIIDIVSNLQLAS